MATMTATENGAPLPTVSTDGVRLFNPSALFGLLIAIGLPLGLFGLVNLMAEAFGVVPYFFSPFGLPGWFGATVHLAMLPLLGAALYLVARHGDTRSFGWLSALIAGLIAFPFVIEALDSLQLSLLSTGLVLLTMATMIRVSRASPAAAWILAPVLVWLAVSATLGLALAAAWTPPFALTLGQNSPLPAR